MVKSILTLTFLPQDKFLTYYGDIEANLINLEENLNIEAFTSWMRTNFVDNYQYKKYNNFERLHHGTPLTSNYAESHFRRLNTYFNSTNPSLTTFSKNILRIHQHTEEKLLKGLLPDGVDTRDPRVLLKYSKIREVLNEHTGNSWANDHERITNIYYYERINEQDVRDFHGRIQEVDIPDQAVEF